MNDTATNPGPSAEDEAAKIIDRYLAASDTERDQITAEHPVLITEEVERRAEQQRPGPQRTWTQVGSAYTTPRRRPDVLRAIASREWHDITGRRAVPLPAAPGLAINACIGALGLRNIDQAAWHGRHSTVNWYDQDKIEGEHYAIYGIQGNYTNGRARVYVIDIGTAQIPLVSDFWPVAAREADSE